MLVQRLRAPEADCWSLTGGRSIFSSAPRTRSRREALEEVGVEVEIGRLLCIAETIGLTDEHWVSPVYRARIRAGEPFNREPDKHAAIGWFALDAAPVPLAVAAQEAIAALRRENGPE